VRPQPQADLTAYDTFKPTDDASSIASVKNEKSKMGVSEVPSFNKDIKSMKSTISAKSNNFKS
jgi:hypothetical protein